MWYNDLPLRYQWIIGRDMLQFWITQATYQWFFFFKATFNTATCVRIMPTDWNIYMKVCRFPTCWPLCCRIYLIYRLTKQGMGSNIHIQNIPRDISCNGLCVHTGSIWYHCIRLVGTILYALYHICGRVCMHNTAVDSMHCFTAMNPKRTTNLRHVSQNLCSFFGCTMYY